MSKINKRMVSVLLIIMVMFSSVPQCIEFAYGNTIDENIVITSGKYTYSLSNGYATLLKYNGTDKFVVVPLSIDKNPIIAIGNECFKNCKSFCHVHIRDNIQSIGEEAFSGCPSLEYINIPDGIEKIDNSWFNGCDLLRTVVITKTVNEIEDNTFVSENELLIYGEPGSYAEKYANENGFDFKSYIVRPDDLHEVEESEDDKATIANPTMEPYDIVEPTATPIVSIEHEAEIVNKTLITGDINKDEIVDAEDALLVLKYSAKIAVEEKIMIEDTNGDSSIDAKDALNILVIAAKIRKVYN